MNDLTTNDDLLNLLKRTESVLETSNSLVVDFLFRGAGVRRKASTIPGELLTEIDQAVDKLLREQLLAILPGSGWRSEESDAIESSGSEKYIWVVDPIDGTNNLVYQPSAGEYGTSIALFRGNELVLGVLGFPLGFSRDPKQPIVLSGLVSERIVRVNGEQIILSSHSGDPSVVASWNDHWVREIVANEIPVYAVGSVVMRLALVATGQATTYVSSGFAQRKTEHYALHDVAGGAAIVRAAGLELYGVDGRPVDVLSSTTHIAPFVAGERSEALDLIDAMAALY